MPAPMSVFHALRYLIDASKDFAEAHDPSRARELLTAVDDAQKAVDATTVHILFGGAAVCGMPGYPKDWELGHVWVGRDRIADATCEDCKRNHARSIQAAGCVACVLSSSALFHRGDQGQLWVMAFMMAHLSSKEQRDRLLQTKLCHEHQNTAEQFRVSANIERMLRGFYAW